MYQINPVDNFFFRSAAPFEFSGETSLIGNTFPPFPSAYSGALKDLKTANRIRIGFNGIAIDNDIYFPKPLDLISYEHGSKVFCRKMDLVNVPLSSFPLSYCLCDKSDESGKVKVEDDLYIDQRSMQTYLSEVEADFECIHLSDYIVKEPKIGIDIDSKSNTAKDKHLFQIEMLRPKNGLKLVSDVKNISIDNKALIKLGGESKMARITSFTEDLKIDIPEKDSSFFKLYLATPAIFKNGWLPAWIDPNTYTGQFSFKGKSVKIELITAAVGKKIPVGGFGYNVEFTDDTKKRYKYKPKEMRYAVPAGSVYYFKLIKGSSFRDAIKLFHQKCISDYREDYGFQYPSLQYNRIKYCDRGFGYAIVGTLNKNQEEMLQCMM